jgi:hypothetical protein
MGKGKAKVNDGDDRTLKRRRTTEGSSGPNASGDSGTTSSLRPRPKRACTRTGTQSSKFHERAIKLKQERFKPPMESREVIDLTNEYVSLPIPQISLSISLNDSTP